MNKGGVPRDLSSFSLTHEDEDGVTRAIVIPAWGSNVVTFSFQPRDLAWPIPIIEAVDLSAISMKPSSYGLPLLCPTPGRVGTNQNGEFNYQGEKFSISPTRHGFLRNIVWKVERAEEDAIECSVDVLPSHNTAATNPFIFQFRANYEVSVSQRTIVCRLTLQNTGEATQPLNAGWHPYLHRSGPCTVYLPAKRKWVLDRASEPTPTGEIREVDDDEAFYKERYVDSCEHWDDVFTDLKSSTGVVCCWTEETVPLLTRRDRYTPVRIRRKVEFSIDPLSTSAFPMKHVQLYTPRGRNAICIEPLSSPPNALNILAQKHQQTDICELQQGERVTFELSVGVDYAL